MTTPATSNEGKVYSRVVNMYIIDCSDRTSATERELLYDSVFEGKVVQDIAIPRAKLEFAEVVPESFGENVLNFVCKASLKK